MITDFKFNEAGSATVSVDPPKALRWNAWYGLYFFMVLITSALAFGPWLILSTYPHSGSVNVVQLLTGGFIPGILAIGFWSVCRWWGFRPISLLKTIALFIVLYFLWDFLVLTHTRGPREASPSSNCKNNLKQLGLAFHNYHDRYGSFPPAYVADAAGKPMHSWRVLILPYLDEANRYNEYNFDEPWNGENNRQLSERIPAAYACPSTTRKEHADKTSYLAVVGPGTIWLGSTSTKFSEFTDGTDQTVMIVEVPDGNVPWMEPRDISFDDAMKLLADHPARNTDGEYFDYHLLMADGSVRVMPVDAPVAWWKAWFTIAGNDEAPDLPTMPRKSESDYRPTVRTAAYWSFVVLAVLPLPWVWRCR